MKFVKDKYIKGELQKMEPYWVLPILFHTANPNVARVEDTARLAAEILNHVHSTGSLWLEKLVLLAHGSLVYRQCSLARSCPNKLPEPLHNFLTEAVTRHDEKRIILALKSIGNAAQTASLKLVRPLAENDKHSKFVQVVAIQALMKIARHDSARVSGTRRTHLKTLGRYYVFRNSSRCNSSP
nr:PREDICTED: vitellogenin [Anolis carolinensis]|eukprot:XP_016850403.1 PREDICTED: vitellogenin [Anolis carolinensis]